jgi:GDP-L-fucose synthase
LIEIKNKKIFLTGHNGMLGKETLKLLLENNFSNIITASKSELDLRSQFEVEKYFKKERPNIVIHLAAKVGGINANMTYPADFIYDNLVIQTNVINSSRIYGVEKFVFIGSSCIYPADSPQPMMENYLLDGKLEPTNEGYAISKITGIKLLEAYKKQYNFNSVCLMPSNLYGPNDSFDPKHSHVLSALVKKVVDAKYNNIDEIDIWGTGVARREFLHINDLANALIFFMQNGINELPFLNIGTGIDITILELLNLIISEVQYKGKVNWDLSKPNGMLRKCLDVSKMKNLGFKPKISLKDGLKQVIYEYKTQNNYI